MKRTVAFIDILGFRAMIQDLPAEELGKKYQQALHYALEKYEPPKMEAHNEPSFWSTETDYCIKHVFSDCVIFVSHDDSEDSCLRVLIFAYKFMRSMLGYGFLLRGGISYNDLFVDLKNSIFVGRALTESYELEQKQEWVGITIHRNVAETFPRIFSGELKHGEFLKCLFVQYLVPMKSGKITEEYTINWRWNLVIEKGTKSLFKDPTDWRAKVKHENSLIYAKFIRANSLAYPTSDRICPIEIRRMYMMSRPPGGIMPDHGDDY